MADRKLIELVIDEEQDNYAVDALSLVKFPAIESDFIFLSKENRCLSLAALDEEKRTLIGPALIPEKHIPRFDADTEEEYDVYFSKETVQRAAELFLEQKRTDAHTFEHASSVEDVFVVESWIVQDPDMDKSKAYGLSVPEGTWMVRVRVDNEEVWQSVKSGEVRGFSIEGYFVDRLVNLGQRRPAETDMVKKLMSHVRGWLKRLDLYQESNLTTGKVIATDADNFAVGEAVYTLDDEGLPVELPDGSYETEGGVELKVAGGILAEYDGEVIEEVVVEEEVTDADSLRSSLLTSYYKKLLELKGKTEMSQDNTRQPRNNKRREFGYNGWANYETWLVNVWDFTNYFFETALEQEMSEVSAEWCRDMFDEMVEGDMPRNNGIISDMVNTSISEIDWRDIADHINDDLTNERG